jgi:hypothetical protein
MARICAAFGVDRIVTRACGGSWPLLVHSPVTSTSSEGARANASTFTVKGDLNDVLS